MKRILVPIFAMVGLIVSVGVSRALTATPTPTRSTTPTPTPTSNRQNDFSIVKVASPSPAHVGEDLTYTLTVHDTGTSFAPTVSLQDTLPANVTLVSVTAPDWTCSSSPTSVTCTTSLFFGGNTRSVVIVVKPQAEGSLVNTARVQCSMVLGCFDPNPSNNTSTITTQVVAPAIALFLRGNGNPVVLSLDFGAPTSAAAKFRDSAALTSGLRTSWVDIGSWPAPPAIISGTFIGFEDLHGWLGLKNGDDQGTQFDLRGEVWKNGIELIAAGETPCIKGVVRDPAKAKETAVPLYAFAPVDFNGTTDSLSLKVLARIGTGCSGQNHGSATGLRFYFDGVGRPSRFSLVPGLRFQ